MAASHQQALDIGAASSTSRLAIRAVRQLKSQVENWYEECRALTAWEDESIVDEPESDRLKEHARMLDNLERVGRWLASATSNEDFPERQTAELVVVTLRILADRRAMWHGRNLSEHERVEVLNVCFHESGT